ncbi:TetR family transcriptional regulator [Labrys sp. LIt4]|uniref:TetR/AcrR family transcriptional regulator n=1 Tax=Labrys sp. LIt4 TaxID=2821355 RepID=UPI001AE0827D|nr:TetR/AcrR family transcriptional regulator [Labrys sp. LIt4]MBP0582038.1 TetR family transcriptional regulator [Labrys sp. LIt4]
MARKKAPSPSRSSPAPQAKRPRNAAATREAILQSALVAFSRAGYDGVGLREIAGEAGVTAILVNRYFGSKEEMFAEAAKIACADASLFEGDAATLADRVAQAMVANPPGESSGVDPFRLMLHSASNPRAAEILRETVTAQLERPLAAGLAGKDRPERAALFLALIAGVALMRDVIASSALAEADPSALAKRLAQMLKPLIDDKPAKKTDKPQQLSLGF